MKAATTLTVLALAVAACTPSDVGGPDAELPAPTTASSVAAPPSEGEPPPETTTPDPSEVEPAVVLDLAPPSPLLPMAAGADRLVTFEAPSLLTHTAEGTAATNVSEAAPGAGELADVSAIVWWEGRFWAFLVGDVSTGAGVASALVSVDGLAWERIDVGQAAGGASVPGALATPEVPQYDGTAGIQHAAASDSMLVAAGWTRTGAGVQPIVWSTSDGETWTIDAPPSKGLERVIAVEAGPGRASILVHTLGPFHFGQDLFLIDESTTADVSLVGDQVVGSVAASGDEFVISTSAFGAPPTAMWEWDGSGWVTIAAPGIDAREGDGAALRPYLLAGSGSGALAAGSHEVAIRRDGAWIVLGSVSGEILDLSASAGIVTVVSAEGTQVLITRIPLP